MKIVIFGAGGRAGRHAVAEAVARGHQVTAVVRSPERYAAPDGVTVLAGDVTDADSVASAASGHDAAISAAYASELTSGEFFPAAARALVAGLGRAGVARLVVVGIGSMLRDGSGVVLHDAPGVPAEHREFSLGHAAEFEILSACGLDWLVVAPPPTFLDDEAPRTGRYRTADGVVIPAPGDAALFPYADLAVALVDEVETPKHSRVLLAVAR
ncbi:NAD(P)-dependent oxidoreductase [Amycolatopsis sp. NPDC059021]|uniref:NAD(P)-dependent oxidoreductase n=1 Tax=Amycolatopsis sp. NPDC059021 TaxID=3346704 RepID=UPI0036702934